MASREGYQVFQQSDGEGSIGSISNFDTPAEPKVKDEKDKRGFTASCPAVLEHSKDESRHFGGIGGPKNESQNIFAGSCPQPSAQEVSSISTGESNGHEDEELQISGGYQSRYEQQVDETRVSCCVAFVDCYYNSARKIRKSWFVYVFQYLLSLQAATAVVMGIVLFQSCEGPYPYTCPFLTILTGIFGLLLIYHWVAKAYCERSGQCFWNCENDKVAMCLMCVLFFMTVELIFFLQLSSDDLQSEVKVKCSKTYFDSMYYVHIANAVFVALGAFIYLPDCCANVCNMQQLRPSANNGHYQPL